MNVKIKIFIGMLIVGTVFSNGCTKGDEKPQIIEFSVTPERPLRDEIVSIKVKATDNTGLKEIGFVASSPYESILAKEVKFSCNNKKVCGHTWSRRFSLATPSGHPYTVTVFAIDSSDQEAREVKIIKVYDVAKTSK